MKKCNILVVEDDPLVLSVVVGMLRALRYSPIAARDGMEGLQRYNERGSHISLVLADLVMPRMGGLQLAVEILARNPGARVFAMTGYLKEEMEIDPEDFGLAGWLEKPITGARLEQIVQAEVGI